MLPFYKAAGKAAAATGIIGTWAVANAFVYQYEENRLESLQKKYPDKKFHRVWLKWTPESRQKMN